ncbi:hypothetical protein [Mycetocola sp. 2940]|uniref:hypothetical protein n=1 Tax=Mycetocola sp. 2940 TaxID=3156452 RepID=UPI003392FD58
MRKRPGVLLPLVVGIVAFLGFGWLWIAVESHMSASTIAWFLSEASLALALAIPAVCLFFVIRALHIRKLHARDAVGPAGDGIAKARDLLWALSHGLLPQTQSPGDIPTDATESVFVAAPVSFARHSQPQPSARRMLAAARARTNIGTAGARVSVASAGTDWDAEVTASVAASDRRILVLLPDRLLEIPYWDITEVHAEPGQLVLRLHSGPPVLISGDAAESLAVLAVWGSVGESALRRHPALAALRG